MDNKFNVKKLDRDPMGEMYLIQRLRPGQRDNNTKSVKWEVTCHGITKRFRTKWEAEEWYHLEKHSLDWILPELPIELTND